MVQVNFSEPLCISSQEKFSSPTLKTTDGEGASRLSARSRQFTVLVLSSSQRVEEPH